jgi:hypothetical protein
MDLAVIGARSAPASIGMPGTNNRVEVTLRGTALPSSVETAGSIPETPAWMNTAVIYR